MNLYIVSTNKDLLDIDFIHDFLCNKSYWADGRSMETVKRSIENSICFGVYDLNNKQIGFARVLTDFAVFGYIMDVFISEEYRQMGLGKLLMDNIMQYPNLQNLQRIMLVTLDAHGLYEQYGFKTTEYADRVMEILKKPS